MRRWSIPRDKHRRVYDGLRERALSATPQRVGLAPSRYSDDCAFGAILEFRAGKILATLFCVLESDGDYVHVGFYTSAGFMVIGENFPEAVFDAARSFIQCASDDLDLMTKTDVFPRPGPATSRMFALTPRGTFTGEVEGTDTSAPLRELARLGHAVIAALVKVVPSRPN
jgi:hypothetical protein